MTTVVWCGVAVGAFVTIGCAVCKCGCIGFVIVVSVEVLVVVAGRWRR